jgi:hypothetical protein
MQYPIRTVKSTPYYERHFMLIEESPHAYVSAFREAQFDALQKRRTSMLFYLAVVVVSGLLWLMGYLHLLVVALAWAVGWVLVNMYIRSEARQLARTFELALEGKDRQFHEYMWRHLDRSLLWQEF